MDAFKTAYRRISNNPAAAISAADADRFIGLQKLFEALHDHAREIKAPRGSCVNLRRRIRDAIAAGSVPAVRVGARLAVRWGDVPAIAAIVGIRPAAEP